MYSKNILLEKLKNLSPCINSLAKEQRRAQHHEMQSFLEQVDVELIDDGTLESINRELALKNYQLTKLGGKLSLTGKDGAFEKSYASRFKYFLTHSDDKTACDAALNAITKNLLATDCMQHLLVKGMKLLDIGSGDGGLGLSIMKQLDIHGNSAYVAVERDAKFQPALEERFRAASIPCTFFGNDFRKILPDLASEKCNLALVSHLYTTTPMNEFFPMVFSLLEENGIAIMAHDTAKGDASRFRSKFTQMQQNFMDHTKNAKQAIQNQELLSITIPYQSTLTFPTVRLEDWQLLYQIKQADFTNTYEAFSPELLTVKNLIDFIVSDSLESFNDQERKEILDEMKRVLDKNNNQFKSLCKIQMVLSRKNTPEFREQFICLKERMEAETSIAKKMTLGFLQSPNDYDASVKNEDTGFGLNTHNP